MKTARRTRSGQSAKVDDTSVTTFSSDLLTPEEERELLTSFWDCKSELVRVLLRHYPAELRAVRPPLEPWPMAQFIREHCTEANESASHQVTSVVLSSSASALELRSKRRACARPNVVTLAARTRRGVH